MAEDLSFTDDAGMSGPAAEFDSGSLDLGEQAQHASAFLKALSHEGRLLILCHLIGGERSVSELESHLGVRQAAVSQQLARLRIEGLVSARRDGKSIYYSIRDPKARAMVELVHELFCRSA